MLEDIMDARMIMENLINIMHIAITVAAQYKQTVK